MIRENLILVEYMVKKRIEEDSKRLDAIRKVNELLLSADIDIENLAVDMHASFLKKIGITKRKPLNYLELELIEEVFKVNKKS